MAVLPKRKSIIMSDDFEVSTEIYRGGDLIWSGLAEDPDLNAAIEAAVSEVRAAVIPEGYES